MFFERQPIVAEWLVVFSACFWYDASGGDQNVIT